MFVWLVNYLCTFCKKHPCIYIYQLPRIVTALLYTLPDKRCLSHGMCLYHAMIMTLHFLNDVTNDAESTQKSKITSLSLI